jgi:hypothetical protein
MARIVVVALVSLLASAGIAQAQEDLPGARAIGMGEAVRATATGAEAVLFNPSGMSLVKQYVIEGFYGFRVEDLGHHLHVSVVDSITSRVAAALFYTFIYTEPKIGFNWAGGAINEATLNRQGHAAGLSLSMRLGDRFMLGLTTKYLHFDTVAPLPAGTQPPSLSFNSVNGVTFDFGLTVKLGDKFNIAAIGQNLWDHGSRESPLSLGIGLAYIPIPVLSIGFDTVVNFTGYQNRVVDPKDPTKINLESRITARLGPGIQWVISGKVPVRAGYIYDHGLYGHFLSLGVGYLSPQFGIDLGYRVKVGGGLENMLMLGLRLFVN